MRSSRASVSLQQSQGWGRALLLLSLQAEVSFLLVACCTDTWNVPGCVHACTCPARTKISCRRDVLPVHAAMDRKEKQPQNLLILSCCRRGTSHGPNSHIQLQKQLLYPGSVLLPLHPQHSPTKFRSPAPVQWVLPAAGRDHGGGTAYPHVPVPQLRTELEKPPPKAGSAALLSSHFSLAAHAWESHILSLECQAAPSPSCIQGLACK